MKKILLGLFILGTLGMAQQNYEVFVKSGVKISQSEVDRDSKEIENIFKFWFLHGLNYKFISSTLSKYSLILGITAANVPSSNGFFRLADFISSKNDLLPPSLHRFK